MWECMDIVASYNLTHLETVKPAQKLPLDLFYDTADADEIGAITD